MFVFFQTRLANSLFWQKSAANWDSDLRKVLLTWCFKKLTFFFSLLSCVKLFQTKIGYWFLCGRTCLDRLLDIKKENICVDFWNGCWVCCLRNSEKSWFRCSNVSLESLCLKTRQISSTYSKRLQSPA